MDGYDIGTYGDRFADVYDSWYDDPVDTEVATKALARLAAGGRVLELGVGTGRLAIALAETGLEVAGIDGSPRMLELMTSKPGGSLVRPVLGDMAGPLPDGPWDLVFVARNTFFNLADPGTQERCLAEVARGLADTGHFALEVFVPDDSRQVSSIEVREVEVDRVVLFVDRHDPDSQEAWSSIVEMTPTGNVFRPCHIRYTRPEQLDLLAADQGLVLTNRWANWDGSPFTADSPSHVSIYRLA